MHARAPSEAQAAGAGAVQSCDWQRKATQSKAVCGCVEAAPVRQMGGAVKSLDRRTTGWWAVSVKSHGASSGLVSSWTGQIPLRVSPTIRVSPPFFSFFPRCALWLGGFGTADFCATMSPTRCAQPENVALPVGGCTTPISAERSRLWAVRGETSQRVRGSETHAMGTSGERRPA